MHEHPAAVVGGNVIVVAIATATTDVVARGSHLGAKPRPRPATHTSSSNSTATSPGRLREAAPSVGTNVLLWVTLFDHSQ